MEKYNEICCDSLKSSIFPYTLRQVYKFVKKWFEYTDNHKIKLLGNNEGNKYHNDMGTRVAILERRH